MIAAEQDIPKGKAQVAAHMTGGVQHLHHPACKGDLLAIHKLHVGGKGQVRALATACHPLFRQRRHHGRRNAAVSSLAAGGRPSFTYWAASASQAMATAARQH